MDTKINERIDATEANWGDPVVFEATRGNYVNRDGTSADANISLVMYFATIDEIEADDAAGAAALERDGGYTTKLVNAGGLLLVSQARELATLLNALADEADAV